MRGPGTGQARRGGGSQAPHQVFLGCYGPRRHARCTSLRQIEMNRLAKSEIDIRAAWLELPPLIKGYLRVGAFVGDGAVIDPQFGTTDVLIVLPVKAINARYISHFGADAQRYAVA